LIGKLLVLDPTKRIGANLEYSTLKDHSFFKGIDWKNLDVMEPPFKNCLKVKFFFRQKTFKSEDLPKENKIEKILKEGLVLKKKSHLDKFNKRKIILYNTQKLEYIDLSKNTIKGAINLTKQVEAFCNDKDYFEIVTPKKTFVFKTQNDDALAWAQLINEIKHK
jgi:hypothetical protein